jgi:hypothetical protein
MIELIRSAGFNRRPQLNKHRCARPQPQMPRRRRPHRASRLFPVTRPRVLPLRRAAPGCGTPPIAILSTVLLSRPAILRPNKQRNNPAKTTGLTVAAYAIPPTPLRRPRRRRSGELGSRVNCYRFSVIRARSQPAKPELWRRLEVSLPSRSRAKAGGQKSEDKHRLKSRDPRLRIS